MSYRSAAGWAPKILVLVLVLGRAPSSDAQLSREASVGPEGGAVRAPASTELPFAPGERLEYAVTMARLRLGWASLSVVEAEPVDGHVVHRVSLEVEIKAPFIRLSDREASWMATAPIRSLAFERHRIEGKRGDHTRYRFDHEARLYFEEVWNTREERFEAPTSAPGWSMPDGAVDEISALYLLRTLPLAPGAVHHVDAYFDSTAGPITFRVLDRERVKVAAGRFDVFVVEPDIPTLGPFRASSEARIYVTDDARRLIVKITTRTKAGTLTFYLKELPEPA